MNEVSPRGSSWSGSPPGTFIATSLFGAPGFRFLEPAVKVFLDGAPLHGVAGLGEKRAQGILQDTPRGVRGQLLATGEPAALGHALADDLGLGLDGALGGSLVLFAVRPAKGAVPIRTSGFTVDA